MNEYIYCDQYIKILEISDGFYIESLKPGMDLTELYRILSSYPFILVTLPDMLVHALSYAPSLPQKFGERKNSIIIEVSEDGLNATIIYDISPEILEMNKRDVLVKETFAALKMKGITFGIKKELFFGEIKNNEPYIVAQGLAPVNGTDSVIKMYEIPDPVPEIKDDGNVNHYELKLINSVKTGEWLGERLSATDGIDGKTVYGKSIPPLKGKNFPLLYDKNTVFEATIKNKTFLYSKINGAASYIDGRIIVSNHLQIDGDVDFKTGNIKFDGYVTIDGTVADGFYVEATKDIEINSPFGLGNIKSIISTEGNIFIKGGISPKNTVIISAKKNVYVKFSDNARITCGGSAHIGFYCMNTIVKAKEVLVESSKGCISGGSIHAEIKVTASRIGSQLEKYTLVEVEGFNRESLAQRLSEIDSHIYSLKEEQLALKQSMSQVTSEETSTDEAVELFNNRFQRIIEIKEEIRRLEDNKKDLNRYLKTKGEGEITVTKNVYKNCTFSIKNQKIDIKTTSIGGSYFVQDNELKFI